MSKPQSRYQTFLCSLVGLLNCSGCSRVKSIQPGSEALTEWPCLWAMQGYKHGHRLLWWLFPLWFPYNLHVSSSSSTISFWFKVISFSDEETRVWNRHSVLSSIWYLSQFNWFKALFKMGPQLCQKTRSKSLKCSHTAKWKISLKVVYDTETQ